MSNIDYASPAPATKKRMFRTDSSSSTNVSTVGQPEYTNEKTQTYGRDWADDLVAFVNQDDPVPHH